MANVPHGNALLVGSHLKSLEGGRLYGSPPDGPHLWPMLLYTTASLRGQVSCALAGTRGRVAAEQRDGVQGGHIATQLLLLGGAGFCAPKDRVVPAHHAVTHGVTCLVPVLAPW
jgi:hypothetical protein